LKTWASVRYSEVTATQSVRTYMEFDLRSTFRGIECSPINLATVQEELGCEVRLLSVSETSLPVILPSLVFRAYRILSIECCGGDVTSPLPAFWPQCPEANAWNIQSLQINGMLCNGSSFVRSTERIYVRGCLERGCVDNEETSCVDSVQPRTSMSM
jgi:hypothetical protein